MSAQALLVRSGYKPQQIQNAVALAASASNPSQYLVNCETDAAGLTITFAVATTKGTGVYASAASALSALAEVVIQAADKTVLHDFKTPNSDIPRIGFMFNDFHRHGGYFTPDVAISADGTVTYSIDLFSFTRASDFPLLITVYLAALSAEYSTVGTGTATVSTTFTPLKVPSVSQLQSEYSFEFALTGLAVANNDVTAQMVEKTRIKQLALKVTTEGDLTDVTITTPETEILSMPVQNMKNADLYTISGHTTGFLRIILYGTRIRLGKSGVLVKVNESTADNPTFYLIGDAR